MKTRTAIESPGDAAADDLRTGTIAPHARDSGALTHQISCSPAIASIMTEGLPTVKNVRKG